MPYGVAFGYAFAACALLAIALYTLQPAYVDDQPNPGVIFIRWAIQGFLFFAIAAYIPPHIPKYWYRND